MEGELTVLWRSSYSTVRDWLYLVKADLLPWFLWPTSLHGHHHSLRRWGKWDGGRDSGPLLWEEHSRFMNQALAEDEDLWSSQLTPSDSFTLWVSWDACDWSPVCSTCCPGIDLLSYQWALEGDGEAPALAPDSSLEWRICRMDLRGGKRVEKCWWLALAGRVGGAVPPNWGQ